MNVFMPERSIYLSVASLDDKRLNKQVLETYQIIKINRRVRAGEQKVGYSNHPVVKYYRDKEKFLLLYGFLCCKEYHFRKNKYHAYTTFFEDEIERCEVINYMNNYPNYSVLYAERRGKELFTVESVYDMSAEPIDNTICQAHIEFRQKLTKKWNEGNPTWLNREKPSWYTNPQGIL